MARKHDDEFFMVPTDKLENIAKGRVNTAHSKGMGSMGALGLTQADKVKLLKQAAKELTAVQKRRQTTDSNNED